MRSKKAIYTCKHYIDFPEEAYSTKNDRITDLVVHFSEFLESKENLKKAIAVNPTVSISLTCPSTFSIFTPILQDQLLKNIVKSPTKSCDLDPLASSLFKYISHPLLTHISRIVNKSFQ